MKLTIETLKKLIKEEIEFQNNSQSCPDIPEKIRTLLKSRNKDAIIQGLTLIDAMWAMDVDFFIHGGMHTADLGFKVNTNTPLDPRVHIKISGKDAERMFLCLGLDKLVSNTRMNKYKQTGIYISKFIPTGMRGKVFASHF